MKKNKMHDRIAKKHISAREKERKMKVKKDVKKMENMNFSLKIKSKELPFVVKGRSFSSIESSEEKLQQFIRLVEKRFDIIWYIGSDYFGDEIYERFIFDCGGFMEISMRGELRCFFNADRREKMRKAISGAVKVMKGKSAGERVLKEIKSGQKLISLKDSLTAGEEK